MKKTTAVIFSIILTMSSQLHAGRDFFGTPPKGTPSVINYGWLGTALGLGIGTGIGYLSQVNHSDSDKILLGAAYGTIVGTGAGLLLGFDEVKKGKKGYNAVILRDMHWGGNLGLGVGAAYGVIAWIKKDEAKYLGESIAWGYILGAIAGLGIGMYEGPKLVGEQNSDTQESKRLIHAPTLLSDSSNQPSPGYQIAYRF